MLRTGQQIADSVKLPYQQVMNILYDKKIPFITQQKGKVKFTKLFDISDTEFQTLLEKKPKIDKKAPLSPSLNILLTPNWQVFMSYILVEHPMELIELNVEISHHPDLIRRLTELLILTPNAGFEEKLAEIAAYCNVLLDGMYDETDIKSIATLCTKRLQEMRTGIIQVVN